MNYQWTKLSQFTNNHNQHIIINTYPKANTKGREERWSCAIVKQYKCTHKHARILRGKPGKGKNHESPMWLKLHYDPYPITNWPRDLSALDSLTSSMQSSVGSSTKLLDPPHDLELRWTPIFLSIGWENKLLRSSFFLTNHSKLFEFCLSYFKTGLRSIFAWRASWKLFFKNWSKPLKNVGHLALEKDTYI